MSAFEGDIMYGEFGIEEKNGDVIISKNGSSFSIEKTRDDDIWFNSSQGNMSLSIEQYGRYQTEEERQTYIMFEILVKLLIARYVLSGDAKNPDNSLPHSPSPLLY